jgi:pimeloyl-ACP methyl ester carboxylesterase
VQDVLARSETQSPADIVAAVDRRAERIETPCGDGTMVWRVFGAGPAVLLLHGGHGAWSHWIRNIPTLAARHTLVVPDMPGYAESASPPEPYTADGMAEIMARGLSRVLGRRSFSIVGFSFGGVMGGHVAKLMQSQTERLVLVGSGGMGLPRPKMGEMMNWKRLETPEARLEAHRNNLGVLMLHDPSSIDALALHLQSANTVRTRINSRAISLTDTLRRCLEAIDTPLAGIWGVHDATTGPLIDAREALLRGFDPAAEFIRLDGGHWIQYERPAEFDAAVTRILDVKRSRRASGSRATN